MQPGLRTTDHPPTHTPFPPETEARMGTTVQGYRGLVARGQGNLRRRTLYEVPALCEALYSYTETLPVPQTLVIPLLETHCGFVSHLVSAQAGGGGEVLRGPEAQVWARADRSLPSDCVSSTHPLLASSFPTPVAAMLWAQGPACCPSQGPSWLPRLPGCFLGLWPEPPVPLSCLSPLSFSPPETVSSSLFCLPTPGNLSFRR